MSIRSKTATKSFQIPCGADMAATWHAWPVSLSGALVHLHPSTIRPSPAALCYYWEDAMLAGCHGQALRWIETRATTVSENESIQIKIYEVDNCTSNHLLFSIRKPHGPIIQCAKAYKLLS